MGSRGRRSSPQESPHKGGRGGIGGDHVTLSPAGPPPGPGEQHGLDIAPAASQSGRVLAGAAEGGFPLLPRWLRWETASRCRGCGAQSPGPQPRGSPGVPGKLAEPAGRGPLHGPSCERPGAQGSPRPAAPAPSRAGEGCDALQRNTSHDTLDCWYLSRFLYSDEVLTPRTYPVAGVAGVAGVHPFL